MCVCVCVSSSTSSVAGAGRHQSLDMTSQQTLHTIVGIPRLDETSDETQSEPDPESSHRTWPNLQSDNAAVVQGMDGSDGVSEGTVNVSFVIWIGCNVEQLVPINDYDLLHINNHGALDVFRFFTVCYCSFDVVLCLQLRPVADAVMVMVMLLLFLLTHCTGWPLAG